MKASSDHLTTPVYLKLSSELTWPEDERVFYLLSRDGLFLCRNHEFFRSTVPAPRFPRELAGHAPHLELRYPRIPRRLFERVIGFFALVAERAGAEAAALLVWNRERREVEVIVPPQRSIVSLGWTGQRYPINVYYEDPILPPHLAPIGDIHCHVDLPAYASATDVDDEVHRPGLHLVVGRINREPPELHAEATIDAQRFPVEDFSAILEGYHQRRPEEVPSEWLARVAVEVVSYQEPDQSSDASSNQSADEPET